VLLISHRFSSVLSADRIFVLDQGRVVERGTHAELMQTAGLYAELFTLQAQAYRTARASGRDGSPPGSARVCAVFCAGPCLSG